MKFKNKICFNNIEKKVGKNGDYYTIHLFDFQSNCGYDLPCYDETEASKFKNLKEKQEFDFEFEIYKKQSGELALKVGVPDVNTK